MLSSMTENTESLNLANYFKNIKSNLHQLGGVDDFSATSPVTDTLVVPKNKLFKFFLIGAILFTLYFLCVNMSPNKKLSRKQSELSKSESSKSKKLSSKQSKLSKSESSKSKS